MSTSISVNGALGDEKSATISVLDRGFLYGDSIYEVMRTYGGKLFAAREHLDRLLHSAELLEMEIPIARPQLISEIEATMEAAGNAESYVRVVITRGSGPISLDPAQAVDPCRVIIVTDLQQVPAVYYDEGVRVCLVEVGRSSEGELPQGAKSGNYLTNLLALREAKKRGAHEALLVDPHGRICEGSTSNVFAVIGKRICTPPLDVGILEGITRRKVIALAKELGHAVEEAQMTPADLEGADEIFITSTIREILPVTELGEMRVGDGQPGQITRELHAAFRRLTAA